MEEKQGAEARKDAAATPEVQAGASREAGEPAGRRRGRRWPIVVGVVAVVLVAAGAGFWVWHEQPGFCNAICHDPMDAYVEGYYEDATLMANAHARADVTCLQCHEAKIEEQVTEGLAWVRGDFATDESGHLTVQGVTADKNWGGEAGVNPHASHQGEAIDCSNCHGAHGASYMYCNTCHDYDVPAGWESPR